MLPRGLLEAVGIVNHEEPGAVGLPARHLGTLPLHFHRPAIGPGALQHPLRRCEGDVPCLGEFPCVELDPGIHGQEAAQRLADRLGAGDDLAGLWHKARSGLVELDHGFDIAGVDRVGEQNVELLRFAGWHGAPPTRERRTSSPGYFSLAFPWKELDAAVTASIPSAHLRIDKTRSIASRKIDLADLHHAVTRRIHDGSRSARLVLGRLKFNLTDGAYRNYRTAAIADFYRCGLRREPFGDNAAQDRPRAALLASENRLELLALLRICRVVDIETSGPVAAGKIFGQIDQPKDRATRQVHIFGLALLDRKCQCA